MRRIEQGHLNTVIDQSNQGHLNTVIDQSKQASPMIHRDLIGHESYHVFKGLRNSLQ